MFVPEQKDDDGKDHELDDVVRSMTWIVEGKIAVGNFGAASDPEFLRRYGFRSVLGLTGTLSGKKAADLGLDALEVMLLVDGPGNDLRTFTRAVETLRDFAERHPPVLVHCHAGRSRSVVVTAAYLKGVHRLDGEEALSLVTQKREASVTPALLGLLDHFDPS